MPGFPKLIPAFSTHIVLDPSFAIGAVLKGGSLTVVPFTTANSYLRSEPDYPIKVDAVYLHGSDFIREDPNGGHLRLDVNSVLKDKNGSTIGFKYTGIIKFTPEVRAVFSGDPNAKTTEFGDAFVHMQFETGDADLKVLEQKVFVGSGRFILEAGQPLTVEYKISEVTI